MKTVPFLNQRGEQVGTATISTDGLEADITIDADYDVLKDLADSSLSIGFTVEVDKKRNVFMPHEFKPSNPAWICNVCGVLKYKHDVVKS